MTGFRSIEEQGHRARKTDHRAVNPYPESSSAYREWERGANSTNWQPEVRKRPKKERWS